MKSGEWQVRADQGGDWNPTLTFTDEATGTPLDFTGYTGVMEVCEHYGEAPKLLLTTENGGLTLGGAAGTIAFYVAKADLEALPVGNSPGIPPAKKYVHSLRLTLGAVTHEYLYGPFTLYRKTGV